MLFLLFTKTIIFRFSKDTIETDVRDKIFEYFVGHPRPKADIKEVKTGKAPASKV